MSTAWPRELVFSTRARMLHIDFDDGISVSISYTKLRSESPSAEVQGHGLHDKRPVSTAATAMVTGAEPVGRYAVRIIFEDGHRSGLYTWDWLYALGQSHH